METRQQRLERYATAPAELGAALPAFPREMWQYRPAPAEWTIHEILVHIIDSEVNSYMRCRSLIAEPGKPLCVYSETKWATALAYHEQSIEANLELFRHLRQASYRLIHNLPESVWAHSAHHPENGLMTLDDWLTIYSRHVPDHIDQMRRVYESWQDR